MPRKASGMTRQFDDARADYSASKASRFQRRRTGLSPSGSAADYHYRNENDWLKLVEYSRDMDRNDPVIGQAVDRATNNAIQGGFTPDINTGDTGLDDELLERWNDWAGDAEECDAAGERCFAELEWLGLRSVFIDGDLIPVGTDEGFLQIFESHRCRTPKGDGTPNVVHGIQLNGRRRPQQYFITSEEIDPSRRLTEKTEFTRYPARDDNGMRRVFHTHLAKRLTQTRGIGALAPVFDLCGMHDDIQFAAALKQQLTACLVILRQREASYRPGAGTQVGERTTTTRRDGSTSITENIAPALEFDSDPGEKIEGFAPNIPGDQFFPHVKMLLTLIGINLGLPLVMFLLDAKETNFSGWRGAVDQARLGFRQNQLRMARRFHTPIFKWKVYEWMLQDRPLRAAIDALQGKRPGPAGRKGLWLPLEWNFPAWPYVDPLKDRAADSMDVGNCQATSTEVAARNGRKFYKIVDRTIEERTYAIKAAKTAAAKINKEFPEDSVPVRWDQLFTFPSPDGVRVSLSGSVNDATAEPAPAAIGGSDA